MHDHLDEPDVFFSIPKHHTHSAYVKKRVEVDPDDKPGFDFSLAKTKTFPHVDKIYFYDPITIQHSPEDTAWELYPLERPETRLNAINIFANIGGLNLALKNYYNFKYSFETNRSAVTIFKAHVKDKTLDDAKLYKYITEDSYIDTKDIDIMVGCVFNIDEVLDKRNKEGVVVKRAPKVILENKTINKQYESDLLNRHASSFHKVCEDLDREKEKAQKYERVTNIQGGTETMRVLEDEEEYYFHDDTTRKKRRLSREGFSRLVSRPKRFLVKRSQHNLDLEKKDRARNNELKNDHKLYFIETLLAFDVPIIFVGVAFNVFAFAGLADRLVLLLEKYNYKALTFTVCSSIFALSQKNRVRFLFMMKNNNKNIINSAEKKRTTITPKTIPVRQPFNTAPFSIVKHTGFVYSGESVEPQCTQRLFKNNNYSRNDRERISLMARDINPLFFKLIQTHLILITEEMSRADKLIAYENFFNMLASPEKRLTDAYLHIKNPLFKNAMAPNLLVSKQFYEPAIANMCSAQKFHAYRHCNLKDDKVVKMKYFPVFESNKVFATKQEEIVQNQLNWALRAEKNTPENLRASIIVNPEWCEWLTNYPKYYTSLHYVKKF